MRICSNLKIQDIRYGKEKAMSYVFLFYLKGGAQLEDAEARRRELLRQTRQLYNDPHFIPAVHPRYGSVYHHLYGGEEQDYATKNTFFLRLGIALLCFALYVWMDAGDATILNVNSSNVVNQIEKQIDLKEVKEVWRNL